MGHRGIEFTGRHLPHQRAGFASRSFPPPCNFHGTGDRNRPVTRSLDRRQTVPVIVPGQRPLPLCARWSLK